MATRAQLSQERSRQRREELLAAAIELFAEGGSRAITHRAVAARAGLPPATTTYYFESIDELISEALGAHISQWAHDLEQLAAIDLDVEVSLDDLGPFMARAFANRTPEIAGLELSIYLASARTPDLRDHATRAMQAFESLVGNLLARIGMADSEGLAAAIVALITGTSVRRQSGLHAEDVEARVLTRAIRDLVAAHALGTAAVDRTLAGLHA
jgi:DNA-binding transcriptional regulator YbjK